MNESLQTYTGMTGTGSLAAQRHRVLRNTYWLLALSMIPTVLGAWIGVATHIVTAMSPMLSLVVFLAGSFGLMFAIEKTKNSAAGVGFLLAFTFFMGLMLSRLLSMVLGLANGASLIATAFGGTAVVFVGMAVVATTTKRDLSGLQKFLTIGLFVILAAALISFFVKSSAMVLTISVLCVALFSAFIIVDLKRVIDGGETNYVTATLAIYLDVYNVFQNLLVILAMLTGNDRR
jgi:modulator of FtsH protease